MNRHFKRLALLLSGVFLFPLCLLAQLSSGGTPLSISRKMNPVASVARVTQPDWRKIEEEDRNGLGDFRFAAPISVNFSPKNAGEWQSLPDGGRVWRLRLRSEKARGLAISFDRLVMPAGAQLFVFEPNGKRIFGAYDATNVPESGVLFVGFTEGEEVIVEYFEPRKSENLPEFTLKTVYHAYKAMGTEGVLTGFGSAQSCNVNVNCPSGSSWQQAKRGVVRIRIVAAEGVGWCSGSMINNTRQDGTPYLLSAFHCADGITPYYDQWTFFFNYESADCSNPAAEPTAYSLQGCYNRAGRRENDFLLLELRQNVPSSFNAYFNGWSRDSTVLAENSTILHHPQGDIKKISRDFQPITVKNEAIGWSNGVSPARSHVRFVPTEGTIEPGSSGGPLFDQNARIIGQLHGGAVNPSTPCVVSEGFAGWLAKSWDGGGTAQTRLKDWLDPVNLGVLTLGGTDNTAQTTAQVSGKIQFWNNTVIPGVKIFIGNDSSNVDGNGNFSVRNVPVGQQVNVRITKSDFVDNGVDAADMLLLRRHIVGLVPISASIRLFAADVNADGEVDAADLLLIRRVILGINGSFAAGNWRFIPSSILSNPNFPFGLSIPSVFQVTFNGNVSGFDFLGVKTGDIDGSANN